jgi:hypothetical protein
MAFCIGRRIRSPAFRSSFPPSCAQSGGFYALEPSGDTFAITEPKGE